MHRKTNVIPFVVALQALAFFVLGFFHTPVPRNGDASPAGSGTDARAPDTLTSVSELPRDLQRERLPIPRFPERKKPDQPPVPTPDDEAPPIPGGEGSKLAALRVNEVPLTGPVAIAISAPMLGLPDSLEGQSLAGSHWLGGRSSGRARQGRGGGTSDMGGGGDGRGIGGSGGGSGGYCPTPGRIGGGGGGRVGVPATGSPGRPAGGSGGGSATGRSGGGGSATGRSGGGGSKGLPAGKGGRTRGRSGK